MKSSNNKVQSNCKKREKIYRKYKSSKLFLTIKKKNTSSCHTIRTYINYEQKPGYTSIINLNRSNYNLYVT